MRKTIAVLVCVVLVCSSLSAVTFRADSVGFSVGCQSWSFGVGDRYEATETFRMSEFTDASYRIGDNGVGTVSSFRLAVPFGGNHQIVDQDGTLVESSPLTQHRIPFDFSYGYGISYAKEVASSVSLLASILPVFTLEQWTYSFPNLSLELGVEAEASVLYALNENVGYVAGIKGRVNLMRTRWSLRVAPEEGDLNLGFLRYEVQPSFGIVICD